MGKLWENRFCVVVGQREEEKKNQASICTVFKMGTNKLSQGTTILDRHHTIFLLLSRNEVFSQASIQGEDENKTPKTKPFL